MSRSSPPADPVMRIMLWIACAALVAMMLTVTADVILRAAFEIPVQGAYDIVSIALLIMAIFGMAPVAAERGEILVDLLDSVAPPIVLRALSLIAALLGVGLFLFCGWAMIQPAMDSYEWEETSLELGLPKWWLWAAAFLGMVGILWGYALQLRAALRGDAAPTADEEGEL